jgi:hypothetical protein
VPSTPHAAFLPPCTPLQVDIEAAEVARGYITREEQELRDVERALEEELVVQHSQVGRGGGQNWGKSMACTSMAAREARRMRCCCHRADA